MTLESLPVLVLNVHNRCNCRCVMCDIWKIADAREMSQQDLERQIESIRSLGVQWVVLSGGEPMMHSNLWRLCDLLRREKLRITLLTSGLLLGRNACSIVSHVDDAIVSLDGPAEVHNAIRGVKGGFELLADGVRRVRALHPGFPISARCTVQRGNFRHLAATVATARSLGFCSLSFLAADVESSAFNRENGWTVEKRQSVAVDTSSIPLLEAEIERLIALGECGRFLCESPEKLRRIVHHFRALWGEAAPVAPPCNAPWTSAVVEADGAVRPCFFHRPVGNLVSGLTLQQILNGPAAQAFRESLNVAENPVCRRCVCSLHWTGSRTPV